MDGWRVGELMLCYPVIPSGLRACDGYQGSKLTSLCYRHNLSPIKNNIGAPPPPQKKRLKSHRL